MGGCPKGSPPPTAKWSTGDRPAPSSPPLHGVIPVSVLAVPLRTELWSSRSVVIASTNLGTWATNPLLATKLFRSCTCWGSARNAGEANTAFRRRTQSATITSSTRITIPQPPQFFDTQYVNCG